NNIEEIISENESTYNEQNLLISRISYYRPDLWLTKKRFQYDSYGNIIKTESFSFELAIDEWLEYDNKNDILSYINPDNSKELIYKKEEFEYDSYENNIKIESFRFELAIDEWLKYENKNDILSHIKPVKLKEQLYEYDI